MDDDLDYLAPGFDPNSVTMPRLRSILVAHAISYPASSKKPQLVELFNQHVAPQAKGILQARTRTQPSTRGITNAASSRATSYADDDDMVAPSVEDTPRRTSRRAASVRSDASVKQQSATPSARASRASTADSARASVSDVDSVASKSTARRTTRRSLVSPPIKEEEEDEDDDTPGPADKDTDSPFTSDNPFQSGSSPLSGPQSDGDRRRTFAATDETKHKKRDSNRRKTDVPPASRRTSAALQQQTSSTPRARARRETESPVAASEDFETDEESELAQEEAEAGKTDLLPPRPKRVAQSHTSALKTAPWAILLAILGGLATLWRQEKIKVGYCGIGHPSANIAGVEVPEWADFLRPQCEPCPQHATCFSNLRTSCEADFVLQPHPLSVGGFVPLPPTCEPDGEKARKVKAVADRAVGELRDRNAKFECGELKDEGGKRIASADLSVEELKTRVASRRRRGMSQDEFEDLWDAAIGEILGRDEVVSGVDGPTSRRNLRSSSLASLPLGCAIRRSVRLALARHLWKLVGVAAVALSAAYARTTASARRTLDARATHLASLALDRLATQAALHRQDPARNEDAYLSMAQLRDDVLRDEFSSRRRQRLWERVQKKVEGNSNVRPMVREGRTGDVGRVWEWIGAVALLEDGADRRRSGFVVSPPRTSSPFAAAGNALARDEGEMVETRKWDEGRPIY